MNAHSENINDIIIGTETDAENGLTSGQAAEKLAVSGKNEIIGKKKKPLIVKFFSQFADVMIIILIIAAMVSFVLAAIDVANGGHATEFFEPILILVIVVLNAVMGTFQESKAEKSLDALKKLSAPHARVIRDSKEQIIDAADIVDGDIIKLEAGDFVPADARLIFSNALKSDESALTGESEPSEKNYAVKVDAEAALGDRKNMVYSGCPVTYGTATAVVVSTGMNTEMGRIAKMLQGEKDTKTPLQKKLASLSKYLGIIAIAACLAVFITGMIKNLGWLDMLMVSVSLAVSAIPEGLPAIVTVVLALGVQRMVKRNAIIKKLPAVETLGGASVICSDKTGTLTQNKMTVTTLYVIGEEETEEVDGNNSRKGKKMLNYAALCSDGAINVSEIDGSLEFIGDPTETAILAAAKLNGADKAVLDKRFTRLAAIPFDSDRKLMTTINRIDKKYVVIVKGAFDQIEKICVEGNTEKAHDMCDFMSSQALRVLAVAYKEYTKKPENITSEELENGLTLMGMVGMIDPIRPEAKLAVEECRMAGIRPVMITGDHIITASAIAHELGILGQGEDVMTGAKLDTLSDEEFAATVENVSVYARVSPENKIRIVKAWQSKDNIVAMTGDGVNDAPALKAADIGCAMGITGTEVSKEAADIILTDDNFSTIVEAVKEGRGIFDNIKKVVMFLLGTNIGELLTVLVCMLVFNVSPLLSMQLLWINLVTDTFPAIALGVEPVDRNIMKRSPNKKDEGVLSMSGWIKTIFVGIMFMAITIGAFYLGYADNALSGTGSLEKGRTMAFLVLSLAQIIHAYNMRSENSLFTSNPFKNSKLNLAALLSLVLIAVVAFVPYISTMFGVISLSVNMYLTVLAFAFVPLALMELFKLATLPVRIKKLNKR